MKMTIFRGVRDADNVLQQDCHADEPNRKWVTDTTSIWTFEGWLHLAVVLDLVSPLVVGWSRAAIQDATLVEQALQMALARRSPQAGLLHHSDRGSTYTAESYQAVLKQEDIQVSMSRTGNCYDTAAMESFFHSFKEECIDRERFQTRLQARQATFDYSECFYNRTRRHSSLNYLSPFMGEQLMC
jgi:putative transposase